MTQLLATDPPPERIVDEAWITCLSRRPTDAERKTLVDMLATVPAEEKRAAVEDLWWSLMTSREFLFRH